MKSFLNSTGAAVALVVAFIGSAQADIGSLLPEPGSFALAGLGIAAAAFFLRKRK